VLTGYLLPLSALLLIGGASATARPPPDLRGRRGVVRGVLALVCRRPTLNVLIAARLLQGAGGALLVPGSLALIEATFVRRRGRAIGHGRASAGWRARSGPGRWLARRGGVLALIFVINLPVALVVLVAARHVPDSRRSGAGHIDVAGRSWWSSAWRVQYALIEGPGGQSATGCGGRRIIGAVALVAFFVVEARRKDPMLPLRFFRSASSLQPTS